MADSITSVVELRDRQEALPAGSQPVLSLDDWLYVIHGVGSDRDTVWTLEEFRNFIQSKFNDIVMNGTGTSVEVKPGVIEVASENFTVEIDTTAGGGIIFKSGNPLVEKGSIRYNQETGKVVVTAGKIDADLTVINSVQNNNVIDVNASELVLTTRTAIVGEEITIHNVYSSDVTVEVHVVRNSTTGMAVAKWNTTLKQRSSMKLVCVAIHNINDVLSYEWSPLSNSEVTVNNL